MTQPTLRTDRLTLEPLCDGHLEYEVELDSDPAVMRYLGSGRARSRAEVEALHRDRLAAAGPVPGLGFWAGFSDGDFVGWWILEPAEPTDPAADPAPAALGYRLLRRYWRRGLASEGARELIRYGFAGMGLTRIVATTMAVNTASRATMTAVGLHHVRTFHLHFDEPIPGTEFGEVEYAIHRDDWQGRVS